MQAIILDGHLKSSLSAVRSLGRAGISISVGSRRSTGMAMHSKYTKNSFVYTQPLENQDAFIENVKKEAARLGGKPLVFTFSDATFLSIYENKENLKEHITFVAPNQNSIEIAYDKALTNSLANTSDIPVIETYIPKTETELQEIAEKIPYPAVIKPRKSVTWKNGKGIFGTASFVHSTSELVEKFNTLKNLLGVEPLIQKFIDGEEYGVEMLAREGKIYAEVVHHRLKSLSPTGGASVLKKTLEDGELKNRLIDYAEKLTKELSWSGPIMVEFKVDSDTRTPRLMEINGRFWGSLPLSVASGVDMPLLFFKDAESDEMQDTKIISRTGIVTNHFLGSVLHFVRVLTSKDRMRKYLYPSRIQAAKDFVFLPRGTKSDTWSFSDPLPSFIEIIDIFNRK